MNKKLSSRLCEIVSFVDADSHLVWDTCCDHGLIGRALLKADRKVIFNDQVDHIIDRLCEELKVYDMCAYSTICCPVADIQLTNHFKETVILAGVGGWTAIKAIDSFLEKFEKINSTFIVSVQKNQETFEEFMKERNFKLTKSSLVEDRGREYNILKYRQR